MSTTAPEYLTSLRDGLTDAVQQWMDQSTTAWDQWSQAWAPVAEAGASAMGMPRAKSSSGGQHGHGGGPGEHAHGHSHGHGEHTHQHGRGHHGEKDCGCGESGRDCGCADKGSHAGDGRGHTQGCGCGEGHSHSHGKDCGCQDSCCRDACDCCVPDADVIVRARAGEVRVVPFRLHNPWRREREVTLEVGPWHICSGDGDLEIRAVLEETKIVLKPCEDRIVRLLVSTRGATDDGSSSTTDSKDANDPAVPAEPAATAAKPAKGAGSAGRTPVDVVVGTRRTTDVESCVSAYADVRFEGCARPQRVAVVVLPGECEAVEIGCDCGCCC